MTAPYRTLPAAKLEETTPPITWIVEGLFLQGGAAILSAPPKHAKSYLALDIAVAVASGTLAAGTFAVASPRPVMLLPAEDPHAVVVERLQALARARGLVLDQLPIEVIVEPIVKLPEGLPRLEATVATHRPGLLLIDPLLRCHTAEENSSTEMSVVLDGLRNLARRTTTSVLVIHHSRKAGNGSFAGAVMRGSSDLAGFADVNMYLRKLVASSVLELKIEHRAIKSPEPLRLKLSVTDDKIPSACFVAVDQPHQDPLAPKILSIMEDANGPVPSSLLRHKLGVRNQAVARALQSLQDDGRIARQGRDGWALVDQPA